MSQLVSIKIKAQLDEVEALENFYIMNIDFKEDVSCQIEYNNRLYSLIYSKNYPVIEPIVTVTNLETRDTMPYMFDTGEWNSELTIKDILMNLDTMMKYF